MIYFLAAVGTLTIVVLAWKAFGPEQGATLGEKRRAPVAPDDDPDFLRRLDEQHRDQRNKGERGDA